MRQPLRLVSCCVQSPDSSSPGFSCWRFRWLSRAGSRRLAALKESWSALKSQWLVATVFHCVLIVLAVSGALLCGIGMFLTGPLYCLSVAILYRDFFPATAFGSWKKHAEPFPEV